MGFGFFGKPQEPRKHHANKRDERIAERAATRGSRESSTLSFSGSQIGAPSHPSMQPSRSRQSSRTRRGSSQSHSPMASPRSNESSALEDKWRHVVSMATGHHQASQQSPRQAQPHYEQPKPSYEQQSRAQQASEQVRELQHKVHTMEAEIQEVEGIKQRLIAEQRTAQEWREKWNFQNFKLNLMVDMMVLQALESEPGAPTNKGAAGSLTTASFAQS